MKLLNYINVPIPESGKISVFRSAEDGGLYYRVHGGQVYKLQREDDLYFIADKSIVGVNNYTDDENIEKYFTSNGIILRIYYFPKTIIGGGGGGRGPQGYQGISGAGSGGGVESGTFTRAASDGDGTVTVATTNKAKIIFFNTKVTTGDFQDLFHSEGKGTLTDQSCMYGTTASFTAPSGIPDSITTGDTQTFVIYIDTGTAAFSGVAFNDDGYAGTLTAINDTSFVVSFTKLGNGQDISVQWHAIT